MTILVVNNKGQYNHRIQRSLQYLKIDSQLVSNTLTIEEIEAKNPTGLILGGGPSIEGSGNSEEYIKHFDVPILGICLGHQLIAKSYGGEVSTSNTESYAQVQINIINDEILFEGLATEMAVWSSHKDEVKSIPEEFEILANSNYVILNPLNIKIKTYMEFNSIQKYITLLKDHRYLKISIKYVKNKV